MAYAKNEDDYMELHEEIAKTNLKPVIDYLEKNWHPIRNEWVMSLQQTVTFGNRTNNQLEALNSKVVQVVKGHSNLPDLFKDLDNLLLSLRTERDNRAAQTQLRVTLNIAASCEDQKRYLQLLTPYAYGLVAQKFMYKDKVIVEDGYDVDIEIVTVKSSAGTLIVSPEKCSCSFFVSMELPCHHIFRIRELKHLSLFSETLVAKRWTKNYYLSSSRLATQTTYEEAVCSTSTVPSTSSFSA